MSVIEKVDSLLQEGRRSGAYKGEQTAEAANTPLRLLLAAAATAFVGYTLTVQQPTS